MSDILFGAIGLVIFIVVVSIAGYFLYKFQNARLTHAWGPLVGLVNGKVVGDGGGAASSWLSGTYQGRPVVAKLAPNLNQHEDGGSKYNYFDVALTETPGGHDWAVDYAHGVLGLGRTGGRVVTKDPTLQAALEAAKVIDLIAPFGQPPGHFVMPTVEYNRREASLRYRADISPAVTPSPEQFGQMVGMLVRLAAINAQVNASLPSAAIR